MPNNKNKKKRYMIDTSVIVDNPSTNLFNLYQHGENEIFISDIVLKEMDAHKTSKRDNVKFSARTFFNSMNRENPKELKDFSKIENTIVTRWELNFEDYPEETIILHVIDETYSSIKRKGDFNDLLIMSIAKKYKMILVTNDTALEIAAISAGIKAETLKSDSISNPDLIDFSHTFFVEDFNDKENYQLAQSKVYKSARKWSQITFKERNTSDPKNPYETGRIEMFLANGSGLIHVPAGDEPYSNYLSVPPINLEQKFYTKILESYAPIIVVTGSTGSGKTLMALQEGVRKVRDKNSSINGIVYLRQTVTTTDQHAELGFRKGDEDQKLGYFTYPLLSAINYILEQEQKKDGGLGGSQELGHKKNNLTENFMIENNIEVYDIAHARGDTLSNKFVIFDEVQNADNPTLKLIGTRMGDHSILILMGDYKQVDHPFLNKNRNALVSMLRIADLGSDRVAGIKLLHTVRSETAEWFDKNL